MRNQRRIPLPRRGRRAEHDHTQHGHAGQGNTANVHVEGGDIDDYVRPRNDVADFFGEEARQVIGAKIYVEPNPDLAAGAIDMEFRRKRLALGWG